MDAGTLMQMIEEENNLICCAEVMQKDYTEMNGEVNHTFSCLECGNFILIKCRQLDEEELENLKEE